MIKQFGAALTLSALLFGANASAASLSFSPSQDTGLVGANLVFTLSGADFSNGTSGGDFRVAWNPTYLSFVSFTNANPAVFDSFFADLSNTAAGEITRVDILKGSAGTVTDFTIATLTVTLLQPLAGIQSTTINTFASLVGWFEADATTQYTVLYGAANASATVIPAPPAVWLLMTGIAGLAVRRLRRFA